MHKLIESYKIMFHLMGQIAFFMEVHRTYMRNQKELNQIKFEGHFAGLPLAQAISGNHLNHLLIIANSFLDEYNLNFTPAKLPDFGDRVRKVKQINKPIMRRIAQWSGLKDYRNYILAHNFRIKGQSMFAKGFEPIVFKVPHLNSEIELLAELIKLICRNTAIEFPELLDAEHYHENLLQKMRFDCREVDVEQEMITVTEESVLIRKNLEV